MEFSTGHLVIVAFVVLVLFGRGKIPSLLGDLGQGIRNFRMGLSEEHPANPPETFQNVTAQK